MTHRAHLFSLRVGHAVYESCIKEPYGKKQFSNDMFAGITVGLIAIPLAMALAIASGVAPQYGLYTVIIAGLVIALTGGSRYSISGPTAAFVVILYPITQSYGMGGLLVATLLAGLMLVLMAVLRLGRLIAYIPEPVTLGFTGGIAVVLATMQMKDFFGLPLAQMPEQFHEKLSLMLIALPTTHWPSLLVATLTLSMMLLWPRLKTAIPAHLPALVLGACVALLLNQWGWTVDTIGSRFSYLLPNGEVGQGIPPLLPSFNWPWNFPAADGSSIVWNWTLFSQLLPKAFAIAMLAAIESLLCAVVLDGMSAKRHSANSELLGQGLGNIVAPFFGGITATAAIARSAASFKSGAKSPLAAVIHALVVLLALVALAPLLAYLPMSAMAALLLVVAWNMSEAPKAVHLLKTAPKSDILVFISCFSLTILFDMVIAITVGILLAAILFMKEIAEMTRLKDLSNHASVKHHPLPEAWQAYKINGPLFFAAADKVFSELAMLSHEQAGVILDFEGVSLIDAGGIMALSKYIEDCEQKKTVLILCDLQEQPLKSLKKAGIDSNHKTITLYSNLDEALEQAQMHVSQYASAPPTTLEVKGFNNGHLGLEH